MTSVDSRVTDELAQTLREILGERVSSGASVREHHSHGESYHTPAPPDLVVYPSTTDEISAIASVCHARGVPVIPFGAGTSLEGQVLALRGGVCIDLSQMNRVLRVS